MAQTIRCYDYVNHPYEAVRDLLAADPLTVFQVATRTAHSRAESVAVGLRVDVAGLEIRKDVDVGIEKISTEPGGVKKPEHTRIALHWQASSSARLFPFMRAELECYPLTATETQLELRGEYEPPLGLLGGAIDSLVGHRIAEAGVHSFLGDVAGYLRKTLTD